MQITKTFSNAKMSLIFIFYDNIKNFRISSQIFISRFLRLEFLYFKSFLIDCILFIAINNLEKIQSAISIMSLHMKWLHIRSFHHCRFWSDKRLLYVHIDCNCGTLYSFLTVSLSLSNDFVVAFHV